MDPGPRVTRLEAEEVLRIEAVLAATETNETKPALPLVFVLWKDNNIHLKDGSTETFVHYLREEKCRSLRVSLYWAESESNIASRWVHRLRIQFNVHIEQ